MAPHRRHDRRRIIPAYAGSTLVRCACGVWNADHPRIRGEHADIAERFPDHEGSSPHTRGAQARIQKRSHRRRIIPAYAGSTARVPSRPGLLRDHPRIRGEHKAFDKHMARLDGSSPHTRGAHRPVGRPRPGPRIIPAYAGSTAAPWRRPAEGGDHPRIRGEHLLAEGGRYFRGWIIPAYAGSTSPRKTAPRGRGDHPRIRGEHPGVLRVAHFRSGSSPHTRGARGLRVQVPAARRIIPAYAGSTKIIIVEDLFSQDHPRIRGEHRHNSWTNPLARGSSPHTRGALWIETENYESVRIIPAYAGSTSADVR